MAPKDIDPRSIISGKRVSKENKPHTPHVTPPKATLKNVYSAFQKEVNMAEKDVNI